MASFAKEPILPLQHSTAKLLSAHRAVIGHIKNRTEEFLSSFYPVCISEWNKIDPEIRLDSSVAVFNKAPLKNTSCLRYL